MKKFNELPLDVQNKAKYILRAYNEVFIVFEYGKYNVGACVGLKAKYAPDHEVIGMYYADDIYTPEERMINYIECFHEYPIRYKGKRDYKMIHDIEGNWDVRFKFDNDGNLVIK